MFLKVRRSVVFTLVAAVSTWLSLAPSDTLAQGVGDNPSFYDLSRQSTEIGWLPGEQYDPRTGQLNHIMTDLEFPGNGLPIIITRRVLQGDKHGIDIPFPRISIDTSGGSRPGAPSTCTSSANPSSIIYTDAFTRQDFIGRGFVNPNLDHFPDNARFVSKDNWIVKCVDKKYVVVSPSGISYTFGLSLAGTNRDRDVQHVRTVSDAYGNTLTYGYTGYKAPEKLNSGEWRGGEIKGVSKITSNDGRQVTIEYANTGQRTPRFYMDSNKDYIKRIYSNGMPNKHEVTYNLLANGYRVVHGDSELGKSYFYGFDRLSESQFNPFSVTNLLGFVTYPTGGVVNYGYSRYAQTSIHTKHNARRNFPLESRRVSGPNIEEGTTTFEGQPNLTSSHNLYARLIKTPSSAIEYRYRKSDVTSNPDFDEGKLLAIKVFPNPQSYRGEYSNALLEKHFKYEVINEFKPGNSQQIYRSAEMVEEKTILKHIENNSYINFKNQLIYTIEYEYDNNDNKNPEFRLRTKREYSPANTFRETKYTYKTIANDTYWFPGLPKTIALSTNDKTEYTYFDNGLVESEYVNGITTYFTYTRYFTHTSKNLASRKIGGETYLYSDYHRGIPRLETDERGRTINRIVNSDGTIRAETDLGRSEYYYYDYDSIHRLVKTSYPSSERGETKYEYKSQNKTYISNPGGSVASSTIEYDGFGRLIKEANQSNLPGTTNSQRVTATQYDSEGRVIKEIYPNNLNFYYGDLIRQPGIEYEYDGIGRKIKTTEILNLKNNTKRIRQWFYTNSGNRERVKYIDSRNAVTNNYFMSYGTPKQEYLVMNVDGNGVRTDYNRDKVGRLTRIKRDGKVREYNYNWKKELIREYHPETGETTYTYHDDGPLSTRTNNGRTTTYNYHPDNTLYEEIWNDGNSNVTLRYHYNDQGLLQSTERNVSDSNLSVFNSYGYDVMGRVTYEKSRDNLGVELQMSYEYDERGNLSKMTYPNGNSYDLAPNAYGQITKIEGTDGKSVVEKVWYYPNGAYSRIDSGGSTIRSGIDHLFQTRNRRHYKGSTKDTHYAYSYNSESSMSFLKNQMTGSLQRMYYDNGNRLTKVDGSRLGVRTFSYNSRDDITSKVDNGVNYKYDYDWRGQLTAITSQHPKREFSYNGHGEVTKMDAYRYNSPDSVHELIMNRDPEGRLHSTSEGTKYGYDSRGLRFFKEKNGRIYSYYDLGGKLRYRRDAGAGVYTEYHYIGNELIAKREMSLAADDPGPGPRQPPEQPPENEDFGDYYTINHETLRLSWLHSAWHQVQKENGENLDPKCDGGSYCVVPEPGRYKFSRHGDDPDDIVVTIGSPSATRTFGDYTVNNSTKTISWSISGWHQVQNGKGESLDPACNGGNSCTVSSDGDYIVINHAKSSDDPKHRTAVTVGQ